MDDLRMILFLQCTKCTIMVHSHYYREYFL